MPDRTWHHHHDGDHQIMFCRVLDGDWDCDEDFGLICEPEHGLWDGDKWVACRYHIAFGDYVIDVGEQLALVTHLELVPEPSGVTGENPQ